MAEPPIPAFYERDGLNVRTYDQRLQQDIVGTSVEGDVAYFIEEARRAAGPVLELGCGTGRVAWALAEAGVEVAGLELSQAMLDRAEAKRAMAPAEAAARAIFVHGDMADFELDRRFGLVIIPFRAFQALLDAADQRRCLAAIRRHLAASGRLIIDVFDPRFDLLPPGRVAPSSPDRGSAVDPASGRTVRIRVRSRDNDPMAQRLDEVWRFTELDPAGRPARHEDERLTMRWTFRAEMRYLLELCGYLIEAESSDFHRAPPAYGREQIWVARLPGR
jgi:SAM-dependent methyltransferase